MEISGPREHDIYPEAAFHKPVTELLRDPAAVARLWPEYELNDQISQHVTDIETVSAAIDSLPSPTTSVEGAVITDSMSDSQATSLYNTLAKLLDNPDYARLTLYLPFEFIPSASWRPDNIVLRKSIERFTDSYMQTWRGLLRLHDVRANFIDGDVLEEEHRHGDVPRVVKAAHFIPELMQKGLLSEDDVQSLLQTPDMVLRQSINEALSELYDMPPQIVVKPAESTTEISPARRAWLEKQETQGVINEVASRITAALLQSDKVRSMADTLLILKETDAEIAHPAFAEAFFRAVSSAGADQAQEILTQHRASIELMWKTGDAAVKDSAASALRRLYHAGSIPGEVITNLDISLPNLAGPFSENLSEITADLTFLKDATALIENDPKLATVVYPVAVVGGSRLKGYGGLMSDVDVSIFIKPGTLPETKGYIRNQLDSIFDNNGIHYAPIEFWLDQAGDSLTVHDFEKPDIHTADSLWTHSLFGGAWIGNERAITELKRLLLPNYFKPTDSAIDGMNRRSLYLQRLEQDLLQYRLLHKGYEKHFPLIDTGKTTDKSVFWDPGYRQLATKLFITQVFLPKITT